jgi:hypothetical protein
MKKLSRDLLSCHGSHNLSFLDAYLIGSNSKLVYVYTLLRQISWDEIVDIVCYEASEQLRNSFIFCLRMLGLRLVEPIES